MTSERIKEIQLATAYPDSTSVYRALLQVWNECEQEHNKSKPKILKTKLLISLEERWKELRGEGVQSPLLDEKWQCDKFNEYVYFLRKPIKLGMFVPTDSQDSVLYEPVFGIVGNDQYYGAALHAYQAALKEVIFDGFEHKCLGEGLYSLSNGEGLTVEFHNFYDRINSFNLTTISDLADKNIYLNKNGIALGGL